MKKLLVLLLSFSFIGFANANANTESNMATAERLMEAMQSDKMMLGGFEAMLPIISQVCVELNLNEEESLELENIYRDWFYHDIDRQRLKNQIAAIYAQNFSEQEMEDIIQFHQTPTGQKLLEKTPELTKQAAHLGMLAAQDKQQQLLEKLSPFMEKHQPKQQ